MLLMINNVLMASGVVCAVFVITATGIVTGKWHADAQTGVTSQAGTLAVLA
jgi:hypothetical protein